MVPFGVLRASASSRTPTEMQKTTPPQPEKTRRIGVFGGTFDPPHIGHVLTGQRVAEARRLDLVLMVVANDPWQKSGSRYITPAALRLRMVEQACYWSRQPKTVLKSSSVEISSGGPSYTADTLRTLAEESEDATFEVIVGSDAAAQLDTWHDADWLAQNAQFVAVQRGGQEASPSPGFRVAGVDLPLLEVSSTEIRHRVASGLAIDHLCPSPVVACIEAYDLYRTSAQQQLDDGAPS